MSQTLYLVQLPFRSLESYFPVPDYFQRLENWYRRHLGPDCTVPSEGIWELPLWITWLRSSLLAATQGAEGTFRIEVLDLSRTPYNLDAVASQLPLRDSTATLFLSPLTQNSALAVAVSGLARKHGLRVVAGGPAASFLDADRFDSIFVGRPESDWPVFTRWLSRLLDFSGSYRPSDPFPALAAGLDYSWANRAYQSETIYPRVFTHHGCPLACSFCADRLSGSFTIPPRVLEADLRAISSFFPNRTALYVGDLTFGISKQAIEHLEDSLVTLREERGRTFRLAVQTNLALIKPRFVERLRQLGVVVVELGVESGSVNSVRKAQKRRPSASWVEDRLRLLSDAGIAVAANLVVGLPDDTHDDYLQTEAFIQKWRDSVWFNIYGCVPYPGTPVYNRLVGDGRIRNWDLSAWCEGSELVFDPYHLDRAEVAEWLVRLVQQSCAPSS